MKCPFCGKEFKVAALHLTREETLYINPVEDDRVRESLVYNLHGVYCPHCAERLTTKSVDKHELIALAVHSVKALGEAPNFHAATIGFDPGSLEPRDLPRVEL